MSNTLEKYLLEAQGKSKESLPDSNPFKTIGFDKDKKRLGWMRVIPFGVMQDYLSDLLPILEGKEAFVFVGMGGSINGMKTLFSLFKGHKLFALDSLDPAAIGEILKKITNLEKTLVISISKSGTTLETQSLSNTLKELFGNNWTKHFLWLADPAAFLKLDSLGWQGVKRASIQFDGESDIGGRFSSPQTLVFFLPLFLLLKNDFNKLKKIYDAYMASLGDARKEACLLAEKYKDKEYACFIPQTSGNFGNSFSSWIVQLFQESLGSKIDNFHVKTICDLKKKDASFLPLKLKVKINNPIASLMAQMYFFEVFVAVFSALKDINFVEQDFVEKYKDQMRKLAGQKVTGLTQLSLQEVIKEAGKMAGKERKFIEVVLYFYPSEKTIKAIKSLFSKAFKKKIILVFIGSDWNHHSYQAAFADKNTFYVLLLAKKYNTNLKGVTSVILQENIEKLKLISKATYLTLKEKSLLVSLA
ncbi:MAG: hypothetical protein WCY05_04180 [Candidatus Omnitrophota bacterium]